MLSLSQSWEERRNLLESTNLPQTYLVSSIGLDCLIVPRAKSGEVDSFVWAEASWAGAVRGHLPVHFIQNAMMMQYDVFFG